MLFDALVKKDTPIMIYFHHTRNYAYYYPLF